ncbi:MAG: energy transducer TonB [Sphingomonas sp.]|nr:energy transducer TonB [Sphingomonas sp.]
MIQQARHHIDPDRIKGAVAAVIVHILIGYALITGFAVSMPRLVEQGLATFTVAPPPHPPAPEPEPRPAPRPRPDGAAAPPNLKSKATEVAAPPPIIVIPTPPPVIVAEEAANGADRTSGAAPLPGPGTGAGGIGDGTGSGTGGNGDGGGGGTPLRQIGGRISYRDYPPSPLAAHIGGTVWVRYGVSARGRVEQCGIERSSGNADLDATTCRLIVERFRFKPRRNARGKPVPGIVVEDHTWVVDDNSPSEE